MYSKFQPYILLFNFSDKYALRKCKYSYYCTLVSSTNTTDSRYITEIVFEPLNTITLTLYIWVTLNRRCFVLQYAIAVILILGVQIAAIVFTIKLKEEVSYFCYRKIGFTCPQQ